MELWFAMNKFENQYPIMTTESIFDIQEALPRNEILLYFPIKN